MERIVTDQIFTSYLDCTYKSFLLVNGQRGSKSEYEEHAERCDRAYTRAALDRIQSGYEAGAIRRLTRLTPTAIRSDDQFVLVERVEAAGLRSDGNALVRVKSSSDALEPLFFHDTMR